MSRHTTADARSQLAHLLDSAEAGEEVVIERRGARFRILLAEPEPPPYEVHTPPFQILDPSLLEEDWSWEPDETGQLQLSADRSAR